MTDRTKSMDSLIAQDADLIEKTRAISNERDAGQPWLRTYDAHLKTECALDKALEPFAEEIPWDDDPALEARND